MFEVDSVMGSTPKDAASSIGSIGAATPVFDSWGGMEAMEDRAEELVREWGRIKLEVLSRCSIDAPLENVRTSSNLSQAYSSLTCSRIL